MDNDSPIVILMGDWCSEELTSKSNGTAAIVLMTITEKLDEKRNVSRH